MVMLWPDVSIPTQIDTLIRTFNREILVLEMPSMLRSRAACKSAGSLGRRESVVSSEMGNTMSHNVIFGVYEREDVQPRG
jgi:hypothetical protein